MATKSASGKGRGQQQGATPADAAILAPRCNPLLLGQEQAEAEVLNAWHGGRMSHAWLLTGPRGIGKATMAFRMARFILTNGLASEDGDRAGSGQGSDFGAMGLFGSGKDTDAPGFDGPADLSMSPDHPVFRRVASGGHADLKVIERAPVDDRETERARKEGREPRRRQEIVVDTVRGIGAFLSLTPAEGQWRVVVVDAADEMNRNAANAVLKVLEEPPRRASLLLVSHNPARLPATIPSRCRRLALRPLAPRVLSDLLSRYRPDLTPEERDTLVALSRGSIGRALEMAGQGGLDLYDSLMDLLRQAPRMAVVQCHTLGDKVARDDAAWQLFRDLLPGWLARLARAGAAGPEALGAGEAVAGERDLIRHLLRSAPLDRWVTVWEKTTHLLGRTEAVNLDRKQAVLAALLLIERAAARA